MATLVVSDQAERDLAEISEYIARDSPANAFLFIQKLVKNFKLIASRPMMGRSRADLSSELRSISFGRYIILYRVLNDGVQIARVVHGARKIEDILKPH